MFNKFEDDFEKKEYIGRQSLLLLQQKFPNYFKYPIHFTTGKYDKYDAYYFVTDDNLKIKKRVIIEIKWRTNIYSEYLLEQHKLSDLLKVRSDLYLNEEEMSILYLCFTPDRTILFNIDSVCNEPATTLKANVATSTSRTNKKNKKVIMLSPEKGKVLDFILNEKQILRDMVIDKILEGVKKEIKGIQLFD